MAIFLHDNTQRGHSRTHSQIVRCSDAKGLARFKKGLCNHSSFCMHGCRFSQGSFDWCFSKQSDNDCYSAFLLLATFKSPILKKQ